MRRLIGLLLIIRALAPILAVLILVLGLNGLAGALREAVEPPLDAVRTELAAAQAAVDTAKAQFETVKTDVETLIARVQAFRVPDLLPGWLSQITFPAISIPDFNTSIPTGVSITWTNASATVSEWVDGACRSVVEDLPWPFDDIVSWVCDAGKWITRAVPFQYPSDVDFSFTNFRVDFPAIPPITIPMPDVLGLLDDGLEGLFGGVRAVFASVEQAVMRLRTAGDSLRGLSDGLNQAATEAGALINALRDGLQRWSGVIAAVLVGLGLLVVVTTAATMLDDFTRGWRLLLGRAA